MRSNVNGQRSNVYTSTSCFHFNLLTLDAFFSGTTVAVLYYADQTWNRGVILAILPPEVASHSPDQSKGAATASGHPYSSHPKSSAAGQPRALVLFLDFGNAEKCSLCQIRTLEDSFAVFNAQVKFRECARSVNRSINYPINLCIRKIYPSLLESIHSSIH